MGSNKLYIDNTTTSTPLVYGDFSKDSLRVNGSLNVSGGLNTSSVNVNGQYMLPQTAGSNGYLMQTDGVGHTNWVSAATLATRSSIINDADNDTKVEVERGLNDDQVHFRLGGTDQWLMTGSRLENVSSGSLAIGRNAGLNETGSRYNVYYGINAGQENQTGLYNTAVGNNALKNSLASQNVAVGHQAAGSNINGSSNIAVGTFSQYNSTDGNNNVSIGTESLHENLTGSGNIAIGSGAGYFETGSNKLYIDNTNTSIPLIYGDFGADSLRVNGSLNINGDYTLPKSAGSSGYVMQTDGNGQTMWVSPATLLTESDPKLGSVATGKVPRWNGTMLTDGTIYDDGSNVGIGVAGAATEKLDVSGNVKASDTVKATRLCLSGGAAAGYVLTSDANGNARWTAPYAAPTTTHSLLVSGNTLTSTVNGVSATVAAISTNALSLSGTSITSTVNGVASSALNISNAVTAAETDPQVSCSSANRYPYWDGTALVDGNIYRNSSGFTGIGVSNPSVPLETSGSVRFSNSGNADIQLNSGTRPTIYPTGPNVPANLDVQLRSAGTGALLLNAENTGNVTTVAGGGNLMVGSGNPAAKLDVAGTFKLGSSGSVLTNVIKSSYAVSTSSIAANAPITYAITVNGAAPGASVSVSPSADMPDGVFIASARVSSTNTVSLKIFNATGSAISLSGITSYYITVIN